MHSVSPSRSSIPENEVSVTVEDFRAPSFSHVIDNAIPSAAMREPLEMIVTVHDDQPRMSILRHGMLTPVGYDDISVTLLY